MSNTNFVTHFAEIRSRAVDRFLSEYAIERKAWEANLWNDWHKIPVFAAMELIPLGGSMRFLSTPREEIGYTFQNRRCGALFGARIEAKRYWTGRIESSKGDVDDAARETITVLIELAYLRATQSSQTG